ncbi:hypothetical protein GCM10023074_68410 [Microbispora amethystogenes]
MVEGRGQPSTQQVAYRAKTARRCAGVANLTLRPMSSTCPAASITIRTRVLVRASRCTLETGSNCPVARINPGNPRNHTPGGTWPAAPGQASPPGH